MSRDTDSPPPGPGGWGEPQPGQRMDRANSGAPQPREQQTESTIETTVTRARISIPGSRPIPPIVVREPTQDTAAGGTPSLSTRAQAPAPSLGLGQAPGEDTPAAGAPGTAGTAGAAGKKASSWFEPRKPVRGAGTAPGRGDPPAAGTRGMAHPPAETPAGGIPGLGRTAPNWFRHSDTPPDGTAAVSPPAPTPAQGTPRAARPVPSGPTTGPGAGRMPLPPPPGEELAATTMDLGGPFPPAPPPGVLHPDPTPAQGMAVPAPGPRPPQAVREPAPEAGQEPEPGPRPRPQRRGRRLRLLLLALAGIGVVAYGAGLLLSSDDVAEGTTVLGIDIGGTTSQEAVNRLDSALKSANNESLTLLIDGEEYALKTSVAGLAVDTEETVRAASGRDYNPVTVIGSLFGAERSVDAVFTVDREKLTVALEELSAESTLDGPVDGSVTFEDGRAIGHAGQAGKAVDTEAAADTVESAFRERAATGRNPAIELPLTEQQPEVTTKDVEQALEDFAEPAMSGYVWLVAADRELPFSPETLSGMLSMEPSEDGSLQPVIDTDELAAAYGTYFDGIMIDAGSGMVEMTPEHAAAALMDALRETATTDYGEGRREAVVDSAVEP